MKRRDVLGALAASVTLAGPAAAQRLPRVGVLVSGDPEPTWTLFRNAMADLGLVAGKTVIYEYRAADSASGKLGSYARELVALKVDVIVAVLSPATAAARAATSTIPIVFNGGATATGVVTNVARPEGNITGAFGPSSTLAGKGVQQLHGIVPGMKAVGLLLNANDPFHVPLLRDVEPVVHAEKLDMVVLPVRSGDEVAAAFDTMAARGVGGALVQPSLGLQGIADRALRLKLPSFSFRREYAESGGLFSYGADQAEINRDVASQVARLLKGATPAELPVQQATKVELVVNQKTARAIGLALPPLFMASANEVLE